MPENDMTPDTNVNLWADVGNLCLLKSISLLKDGPCTMNTIKEVKALVEIATAIDTQNLCWETKCKDKKSICSAIHKARTRNNCKYEIVTKGGSY